MFASETVFIQVRDPVLIKRQWINSSVRQPFWGLILGLASVTSETQRFRGEGYELLQEEQNGGGHSLTNERRGLWIELILLSFQTGDV